MEKALKTGRIEDGEGWGRGGGGSEKNILTYIKTVFSCFKIFLNLPCSFFHSKLDFPTDLVQTSLLL